MICGWISTPNTNPMIFLFSTQTRNMFSIRQWSWDVDISKSQGSSHKRFTSRLWHIGHHGRLCLSVGNFRIRFENGRNVPYIKLYMWGIYPISYMWYSNINRYLKAICLLQPGSAAAHLSNWSLAKNIGKIWNSHHLPIMSPCLKYVWCPRLPRPMKNSAQENL